MYRHNTASYVEENVWVGVANGLYARAKVILMFSPRVAKQQGKYIPK